MVIPIVIAEDQALIRSAFTSLLDAQPDLTVIAAVGDGAAAVEHAPRARVVVMDIRMPLLDGIEATRRIKRHPSSPRILMLTTFREEELVLGALDAGADGFLLKDSEPTQLLDAVRRLARGEGVLDPAVTPLVLRHVHHAPTPALPPEFTGREAEVLALLCRGLTNHQIAKRLVVADTTVKTHVKSLLHKTGATNRVNLVIWAARHGLL